MKKRDFSPYFPEKSNLNFTQNGIKFKTNVANKNKKDDNYDTVSGAEERAYNLGCSGYRRVIVSAKGDYRYAPCSSQSEYYSIIKEMVPENRSREYYKFDQRNNLFDIRDSINDETKEGYDYKETVLRKTLSNVIYRDPVKASILDEMQRIIFGLIESVKQIRNHFNYTVPWNNKRVF